MAANVEGAKDGLFFFGTNGHQANSWGNGTSFQCVVPPVKRAGVLFGDGHDRPVRRILRAGPERALVPDLSLAPTRTPAPRPLVQAQLWYRDPLSTSNQTTSLSDAIEFCVAP